MNTDGNNDINDQANGAVTDNRIDKVSTDHAQIVLIANFLYDHGMHRINIQTKNSRDTLSLIKGTWLLIVLALNGIGSGAVYAAEQIGAIGHLTPVSEIIDLSGPHNSIIDEILVVANQQVTKGEVLVKFSTFNALKSELDLALLLQKEQERTQTYKIDLQDIAIKSASILLQRSQADLKNYQKLSKQSISVKEMLRRERQVEDTKLALAQESILLSQLETQLELGMQNAKTKVELSRAKFGESFLVAPIDGLILEIQKQLGEYSGNGSILRMADISKMYVRCEIYQGDLLKVKPGMKVKISSTSLPEDMSGKVDRIGRIVTSNNRLAIVWVLLDQAEIAAKLIGMEVQATIFF